MKKKFDRSRWRAFFLAVLLAAEMFTAGTHIRAASVAEEDLFTYFISGNEVTITGTTSLAGKDLVIPDTLEGKPVTAIRGRRFLGPKEGNTGGPEPRLSGLTSVEIPASVTEIGSGAFLFCPELTSITVNEENPVYHSAGNCLIKTKAKELIAVCKTSTIPSDGSVISIGEGVFSGCNRLTSIELPSSVTKIGDFAFSHCTELTSIKIPGVTSIGYAAFWGCTGLASIELPSGVTSIGTCAFFDCTGLTSIEIPDGVTTIDGYAFEGCTGLTSIEIPSSVTSIGGEAFWGCTGLGSIVVNEGNPAYHSAGNCLIETKTKELIAGCKTSIIPSDGSVISIGDYAFEGRTGLTSIEIPSSVTTIGRYAFEGCTGLTSIEIPSSVTSISSYAFRGCTGLTSIEIPSSVTSIGESVFNGCTGLTSIEIPAEVTEIKWGTFWDCSGLTSVEIPEGVIRIAQYAFSGCTGLTSIEIPSSVTSIGYNPYGGYGGCETFCNCAGLTSIIVNEGNPVYHSAGNCLIETKTKELIAGCKTSIIPSDGSVTEIGDDAFAGTGLTSIEIPASVTTISKYAFLQCPNLTIRGYSGTRAESFAGKNGIPFYEIVFGDLDKKDGVGSADAVYLLMHVFYPEDYPVAQLCDFNGDSKVDSADAVYLLMYVFYPEDYPLPQ